MKVVVNKRFGGFGLSKKAYEFLGLEWDGYGFKYRDYNMRTDHKLVECVETLGREANGTFSALKVVDIPDDVDWEIDDYDGFETIHEVHKSW